MKILVTVASKYGSTREIARAIAETLQQEQYEVTVQDVEDVVSIKSYDAVVFGSAIYAGNWMPEAKKFAETYRANLSNVPLYVFSSGPIGDDPKPVHDPTLLAAPMGSLPIRDHKIFVGKLDINNLNFAERLITKALKSPTGDFRNWEEIRAWAHSVAVALSTEITPHA